MTHDSSVPMYEFFAGGGMARLGLGEAFQCVFANDISAAKAKAYKAAFGGDHFVCHDVWQIQANALPGRAWLAWASSPCQDVSLAGARQGLNAPRSGAFWGFWRLIEALHADARPPETIVIENVCGLLSANSGQDFSTLCSALAQAGYAVGALEIDAALFVPQSRPRLFVVASLAATSGRFCAGGPQMPFHSKAVVQAYSRLPAPVQARWHWWRVRQPPQRNTTLRDVLDWSARWDDPAKSEALVAMMAPHQQGRLGDLCAKGGTHVGAGFRRIRTEAGQKVQRFEVRFDGLAGCVRTPGGGSSRQTVVFVDGGTVRTRLLTSRECARLMGLPDHYPLPSGQTAALQLVGDGVAVPVARWLGENLLGALCGLAPPTQGMVGAAPGPL
jgi:DNA (cytosine-5)-methyltransferase 1